MVTRTHAARTAAVTMLMIAGLSGCGGDSDEGDDTTSDAAGGDGGAACATDLTATFPDGSEVALDNTAALDVASGAAYTIYAADFDVAVDSISGAVPDEDGHLATLAITTFNATGTPEQVEEGATIEWTDEFEVLTFSVVFNQGTTAAGNTAGAAGSVDVVSVDEDSICLDVDYSDDEKSLVGTIAADIG